jgi:PAS domain S-box-containing protein
MVPDTFYLKMIEDIEDYAILFLNTEGCVESWNKGAEKIKGYKPGEITGRNFAIFYTEEDQKNGLPQQLMAEARLNGKALHEGWRVRKDRYL